MARVSYSVRSRRSAWWVSLPLWVWVVGFPLILSVMALVPMTKAFLTLYTWPLRAGWKALGHRVHAQRKQVAPPVWPRVGYPVRPVTLTGYVDRNGVFHPFR